MEEADEDIEEVLDYLYSTGHLPTDNHLSGSGDDFTSSHMPD
jgi:hypothetical protein